MDNDRHTPRLTDEEIHRDAKVHIAISSKTARNWSLGLWGLSSRTVINLSVVLGSYHVDILLQRAGPGGRVPVTHKSETKDGDDTLSYIAPGSWRTEEFDPSLEDQSHPIVGRLQVAFGRWRPLQIDFSTLRRWMNICDDGHELCKNQYKAARVPRLRLVDVNKMCIIDVSSRDHYPQFATLSYVWGREPFLRLSRDNLKHLMTPGSLDKTPPPLTIRDALQICHGLQLQFIWVDGLCIIQDDKSDMIDSMDSIYRQSVITIVAASGASAHAGIPGVRPETRHLEQHKLQARGVQLIDSVDSKQLQAQGLLQEPEWISGTPWAQRAWTFQEGLVSRRLLIFTAEQVYWSCRRGLLSEDTVEHFEGSDAEQYEDSNSAFNPLECQSLAITFSKCNLTYESDIQRAYLGVQNHLDKKWGGHKFSWGLPHGSFCSSLMWEWEFDTGRRPRNGTHPIKSADGTVTRASFPSWSWMGWTGGGQIHSQTICISPPHYPSFYTFDLAAELVAIQHEQRVIKPKPLAELLANSETGNGDRKWRKDITEADFTPALISNPALKHSALLFYTQTAKVRYDPTIAADVTSRFETPSNVKRTDQTYPFSVMIRNKFYKILEEHQRKGQQHTGTLEEVTLAVVFAERTLNTSVARGEFKLYCWLIIERDGIWMRRSYMNTVVSLDMWKILSQKSWELICMI
uniref:Heterokaryon incompatibility domain-containing protein n=1 Tax=Bionectria ochroleuca TaxID=29856 RepID=A0A0B7JSB1_BIOOC